MPCMGCLLRVARGAGRVGRRRVLRSGSFALGLRWIGSIRVSMYGLGFHVRFTKLTDSRVGDATSSKLYTGGPVQALDRQPEVGNDHRQSRGYSYEKAQWHAAKKAPLTTLFLYAPHMTMRVGGR